MFKIDIFELLLSKEAVLSICEKTIPTWNKSKLDPNDNLKKGMFCFREAFLKIHYI